MDGRTAIATGRTRPASSFILGLLCTGLGQVHNGQTRKALIFYLLSFGLFLLGGFVLMGAFAGMVIWVALSLVAHVAIALEAAWTSHRGVVLPRTRLNHWYVYLLLLVLVPLPGGPVISLIPFKAYRMPSISMEPTIRPPAFMMSRRNPYRSAQPQRGDIIAFPSPTDASVTYVKRVIGLPGEMIEVRAKAVVVDGSPLVEPYVIHSDPRFDVLRDSFGPFRVPEGNVFVLGDNRDQSADSRVWGPVHTSTVSGLCLYCYLAADRSQLGQSYRVRKG